MYMFGITQTIFVRNLYY